MPRHDGNTHHSSHRAKRGHGTGTNATRKRSALKKTTIAQVLVQRARALVSPDEL